MTWKSLSLLFLGAIIQSTYGTRRIRDISNSNRGTPETGRIADYAMKALGSFKRFMKEGNPELGIPTLDPVHMESFNYSLENSPVGFQMEIQFDAPSLMGLSNYELNGASELRGVDGSRLQMTIVFPTVQIKGAYKAKGNLFGFFPLQGQGDFDIIASNQVLSAEAKLGVINESLQVDQITSQFVGGRVKSQFTDPGSSGSFAGLLSEFLGAMGTHVFDKKLKPIITLAMNDYMKEWLNGAFGSVSLSELLGHQPVAQAQAQPQPPQFPQGPQQQQQNQQGHVSQQIQHQQGQQLQSNGQITEPLPQLQQNQSPSSHFHNFQPFGR